MCIRDRSKTSSNEGLGGILGQFAEMMRGQMPGMQPAPQQPQMPANPFEAILKGMFGQAGGQPQPSPQAAPSDPFGGALGQILGGMFGGMAAPQPEPAPAPRSAPRRAAEPEPEPEEAPSSSAAGPGSIGLDALNQMFEHGRQIQDDHQNALKSILDAMLGGGQGRR